MAGGKKLLTFQLFFASFLSLLFPMSRPASWVAVQGVLLLLLPAGPAQGSDVEGQGAGLARELTQELPPGNTSSTTANEGRRAAINSWLDEYFSTDVQQGDSGHKGRGVYLTPQEMRRQPRPRPGGPPTEPCLFQGQRPVQRENLVVAPVGDGFFPSMWMSHPQQANFDLVLIYFGANEKFSCDVCKEVHPVSLVYRAAGPKWKLMYDLYSRPEWAQLAGGYKAIMVADDDLEMDACAISNAFNIFHEYGLLLAGPSLCISHKSHTPYKILYQKPQYQLRFTTFVEIMAPIFRMDFFNGVVGPTLHNVHTGWGLDFVWPFLLKYPKDKVAVIDEICVYHPHSSMKGGPGLYDIPLPYSREEEQRRREAEYGVFPSEMEKLGWPFHPVKEIGGVLKPPPEPPRPPTPLQQVDQWLARRLGMVYPLAVILQSVLILLGVAFMCQRRLMGRRARLSWGDRQAHGNVQQGPAGLGKADRALMCENNFQVLV